ncbi:hypothetical protein IKMOJFFE_00035 [Vaccinia virus]|uniref:Uncharacterized protein n=1 Tax=Vaccinia virus TaxID=10245 RepID=A0A7G4P1I9_VACCV|nr:hypothetical protein IKMOJFFE_00035 [Vaccinia virus]
MVSLRFSDRMRAAILALSFDDISGMTNPVSTNFLVGQSETIKKIASPPICGRN